MVRDGAQGGFRLGGKMRDQDISDLANDRDPSIRTHADIYEDFDDIDDGFDFEAESEMHQSIREFEESQP